MKQGFVEPLGVQQDPPLLVFTGTFAAIFDTAV